MKRPGSALRAAAVAMLLAPGGPGAGEEVPTAADKEKEKDESGGRVKVTYGPRGLEIASADGNYRVQIRWRLQFRISHPFDADPVSPEAFAAPARTSFAVRRARFKLGGHAIRPWIDYYFEYDFPSSRLLDFRVTLGRLPWLQLRVGQWKAEYNRERRDSSGDQQFAERSIVNSAFTIDRQPGLELTGRVLRGTPLDSTYFVGVFTGLGPGGFVNDDSRLMWMARYQWNMFGRELPFAQSDVGGRTKPAASLAVATVADRSPFTAFSSSGGGQLPGFAPGGPGQYSLRQWLQEAALHYRGFSFQQEFHWKRVLDHQTGLETRLRGSYVQAGMMVYRPEPGAPKGLEVAARYAFVDPDASLPDDRQQELTGVFNWFFRGHSNKITLDFSRLSLEQPAAAELVAYRVRLQWDVHF